MRSTFGGTWEEPVGGVFKFAVKRALNQDQIVHMEGKLQVIRYFSREGVARVVLESSGRHRYYILFYLYVCLFAVIIEKKLSNGEI